MNVEKYLKKRLGVTDQWDRYDFKTQQYSYDDIDDIVTDVVEKLSLSDVVERDEMRKQAIAVFELTKGFTVDPKDNAMKTALEMAGYVIKLTN